MLSRVLLDDTIAAVVSPRGRGGISVIRVSGPHSLRICRKLCGFIPTEPESHKIYLGILRRPNGEQLDQVLASYFVKGKSFTGEETIEISCHGNPVISSEILSELVLAGARIAERGEFSYRAFMNGKIDLVQAESILTLIEAEGRKATTVALSQLSGNLSVKLGEVEHDLIHLMANLEASIDFSTEDIEPFSRKEIEAGFDGVLRKCGELLASYKKGRLFNGFHTFL
jgi:tRNA modification GTPase